MKKFFYKSIALLLVVLMAFGAAPILGIDFSTQASALTEGIYEYDVTDGKATITACDESVSGAITIPSTLGGYPVTSIGEFAFSSLTSLTSVTIPEGVTSIGDGAFSECTALTSIDIPASVTSIGDGAFNECTSLTSVTILKGVTSIGEWAFYGCTSLTNVTIPEGVTDIDYYTFSECTSLANISIPTSVTLIRYGAFYDTAYYNNAANWTDDVLYLDNCLIVAKSNMRGSYVISAGTRLIADGAFEYCDSLTSVSIPEGVTSIGDSAFYECTSLTSINIPESVTRIGDYAFYNCFPLMSINIPASVKYIGYCAFCDCNKLTNITVASENPNYSSDENGILFNKDKTVLIQYPIGKEDIEYQIPASVTVIGDCAFYYSILTSINIPKGVTSIGDYAFQKCYYIAGVTFDKGSQLTRIGESAFSFCVSLRFIHIPASVTEIGNFALIVTTAYICSDTADCYAKTYADENDIGFKVCSGKDALPSNSKIAIYFRSIFVPLKLFFITIRSLHSMFFQ